MTFLRRATSSQTRQNSLLYFYASGDTTQEAVLVSVTRTSRKASIAIEVKAGAIRVLAPKQTSELEIQKLLERKQSWIAKKLAELSKRPKPRAIVFTDGATLPWLGDVLTLHITIGREAKREGHQLKIGVAYDKKENTKAICQAVLRWYRQAALEWLQRQTEVIAARLGIVHGQVKIRDYKARWGSCSSQGDITYNWRLIMAPQDVIEYVIVHELCHIREHNHSRRFWAHVEAALPDYKRHQGWLRANGDSLTLPIKSDTKSQVLE